MPVVFEVVDDLGLLMEIGHTFLRKRGSDNIAGQVFHGLFFPGMDSWTAINLKSRMLPGFQQVYMIGSNFSFIGFSLDQEIAKCSIGPGFLMKRNRASTLFLYYFFRKFS